ncbi:MAG: ATP synthase F0 subunit B [Cyanobacteria bacterium TGS_CYA1]|nr:ATP synthase F0 subunit B [Cyanobacteria bacterium TGS_CYA1]MDX2108513.1 ATP synthase F0 subunit B [Candidatus Melainabacteria bacterium]
MFFFAEMHEFNPVELFTNFKTNLVNWLILMGLIIWAWNKAVPGILDKRAKNIDEALNQARASREESEKFLSDQRAKLANAESEAAKILADAKDIAAQMKADLELQTQKDMQSLVNKFDASINSERQVLVNEIRSQAVHAAVALSRQYLAQNMSTQDKEQMVNQFLEQLDTLDVNPAGEQKTKSVSQVH